jgi:hypothetical protein
VYYSYGRFNVGKFDIDPDKDDYLKELREYFVDFHDWWDYDYYQSWRHTFVSEYTTAAMPTSGFASTEDLTWRDDWPTPGSTIQFECESPYIYMRSYDGVIGLWMSVGYVSLISFHLQRQEI